MINMNNSSQVLNVGRRLELELCKHKFTFYLGAWGYHIYKDVWKPPIGEKLHAEQELDNAFVKFVRVVKYK